ncbi:MAG: 2-amino-4-hydroxy-6-hydroxymethyldihydropteridine diphosphokinase [Chloroflexi bacterium]|nr:2-amino-4-hydroxy-6-hydroxymethyldihydropteridine diphosphokinase [Chloroflexota bacterium]
MDIIEVRNLRLRAIVGFSPHELDAPQDIVVNLRIGLEERRAGETDDPNDAFNYRTIVKAIIQFVENSRFALLEKLAEEIARLAVFDFKAPHIEVRVYKPGALRRSDSVGIRIVRRPADYEGNIAYLSLGSNISPKENIAEAVRLLRRYTTVLHVSPVYRSPPQGFPDQEHFLNAAVKIHTWRGPAQFKSAVIDRIEADLQRARDPQNKNAPRTIDLDISLWNDEIFDYGSKPWHIPDGDITQFAHVAVPLADLASDYVHPTEGKALREIAAAFDSNQLRRINLFLGIG